MKECFSFINGQHSKTFPSYYPLLCLDRIYVKGLKITKEKEIKTCSAFKLSDHLPLSVELSFEE